MYNVQGFLYWSFNQYRNPWSKINTLSSTEACSFPLRGAKSFMFIRDKELPAHND